MFYVIAYDVASDRRRKRIADLLRTYGLPVQLSVVECELSNAELSTVRTKLAELINSRRHRISIYPQCQRCSEASEHLGFKISQVLRNL
jgi:CRISPR-associated protein Cas2